MTGWQVVRMVMIVVVRVWYVCTTVQPLETCSGGGGVTGWQAT